MRYRTVVILLAGVALLGASACSDDGESSDATTTTEGVPGTPIAVNALAIGAVLIDEAGHTLYFFDGDEPDASNCLDACAEVWIPIEGRRADVNQGPPEKVFGSFERPDGVRQLTLDGRPLYRFVGDELAGDANGQGTDGVWWVAGADGFPIKESEESVSTATTAPSTAPGTSPSTSP